MRRKLLFAVLVTSFAFPVHAQGVDEAREWAAGPAGWLLTADETSRIEALTSDEEAAGFVELFWARRDPDLNTRVNEFKIEFDNRVIVADREFAEGDTRGALTDRGKVLCLLGIPSRFGKRPIGDYLAELYQIPPPEQFSSDLEARVEMHGISFNLNKGEADAWAYNRQALPQSVHLEEDEEVVFAFFDTEGNGEYRLQGNIRLAQKAEAVLRGAPEMLLFQPQLTELPVYALLPGSRAARADELALLDAAEPPWPDGAEAAVAQGVRTALDLPAWLVIRLPLSVVRADAVVGRLRLPDGAVVGTFQQEISGIETASGTVYELSLPAPAGESTLSVSLLAAGEAVATHELDLTMAEAGGTFVSRVFAGSEVSQVAQASAGDPNVFGGYHLIPNLGATYAPSESLNLFCFVVAPEKDEDGMTDVMLRMRWYVDGKPAPSAAPKEIDLASIGEEVYVWGTQLPLSALSPEATYSLQVKIMDAVSGTAESTEIPVNVANN